MRDTITLNRINKYTKFLEEIKDKCDQKITPHMVNVCKAHSVSRTIVPILRKRGALKRIGGSRNNKWEWNENYKITKRFVRTILEAMAKENHYRYVAKRDNEHEESQKIAVGATAQSTSPMPTIVENAGTAKDTKKKIKRATPKVVTERENRFHMSIGWGLIKVELEHK